MTRTALGEVRALETGHWADRLEETKYPVESEVIARGLNALLQRLEVSFEREWRFSSHAAPEPGTPLAEMKNIAELGCLFQDEATPGRCREIVAAAGEMEQVLAQLPGYRLNSETHSGQLVVEVVF